MSESRRVDQNDNLTAARALLARTIAMDAHIDTVQRVMDMGADLGVRSNVGQVDIPRLREGGMRAPFFALRVPVFFRGAEAVRRTLDLRDAMQSVFDAHRDQIEAAMTSAAETRLCRG